MKQHLAIAVVLAFLHPANSCEPSSPPQNSPKTKTIRVRIYGEINQPQILDLPRGSTLRDAIKAGDGVTPGGANRRIKVFQNKSVKSYDLTKEAGPILAEDAYVSVPFLTSTSLAESTAKESVDISATKPVPLEDLKILLQRKVKGEWVINRWRGKETLEVRMEAGRKYRKFSISFISDNNQKPNTEHRPLYCVTAFPRGFGLAGDKQAEAVIQEIKEVCQGQ